MKWAMLTFEYLKLVKFQISWTILNHIYLTSIVIVKIFYIDNSMNLNEIVYLNSIIKNLRFW